MTTRFKDRLNVVTVGTYTFSKNVCYDKSRMFNIKYCLVINYRVKHSFYRTLRYVKLMEIQHKTLSSRQLISVSSVRISSFVLRQNATSTLLYFPL